VILGLALGASAALLRLRIIGEDMAGLRLNYEYPFEISLVLLPVILLAAFLSAMGRLNRQCADRWWRRWSMNRILWGRMVSCGRLVIASF